MLPVPAPAPAPPIESLPETDAATDAATVIASISMVLRALTASAPLAVMSLFRMYAWTSL